MKLHPLGRFRSRSRSGTRRRTRVFYGRLTGRRIPAELKLASIATRDIAAAAVRSLLAPPAASEVVYVLGAHEYSAVDQAAYLSKKLGKDVRLVDVPVSGVSAAIQQGGMGASMANLLQEMYEGATKGLLGVEPGYRVERGDTTLEQALDPHFAS
jgi:uncharacterized protein YbjT (DUF2867 family)